MKDFLKYTLATLTGIVLAFLLCFFFGLMTIYSAVSSSQTTASIEKNSVMTLNLNGVISERNNPTLLNLLQDENDAYTGLDEILLAIKNAKEHEDIKGIHIVGSTSLSASVASLQEIHDALEDFKESGKFITAYGDNYSQGAYYVASVADKLMMNPQGMLMWQGLASTPLFFKDLLDKIGIEMQIFKVGTYKSAVEPYMLMEMSDANREQLTSVVQSFWKNITEDVAASRNITTDKLNELADQTTMFYPAIDALNNGMLDTLVYKNDVRDYLKHRIGVEKNRDLHLVSVTEMASVSSNKPKDKSGNIVAVYYAVGEIDSQTSSAMGETGINSGKVIKDLRDLQENKDVKAVVVRVNSPGGSAFGSEQLWHAISELKKEKPVIISMGDYAASGGYYLSAAADFIVAEPTTLTGSIGIFGTMPNAQKLVKKIGINIDAVKTNKHSDLLSQAMLTRPMSEEEAGLMQMYVNNGYDLFLTRVSEGRNLSKDRVDEIGQGRVWTGEQALAIGLVDELGGIEKAVEIAVERAGIETYTRLSYPAPKSLWSQLLDLNPAGYVETRVLKGKLGDLYYPYSYMKNFSINDMLQARMPYELNIR